MIKKATLFTGLLATAILGCEKPVQNQDTESPQGRFPKENFTIRQFKDENGGLCYISFNAGYRGYAHKHDYPWALFIDVKTEEQNKNGHPTTAESEVFDAFEDTIVKEIGKRTGFHYLGRSTLNGRREIFGYLDQPAKAEAYLNALQVSGKALRKFTYSLQQDPAWDQVSALLEVKN